MPRRKVAGHPFLDVIRTLNRSRVRYLVAGGTAINFYGVPRNTYDLDLYVDLEEKNLRRMIRALTGLGMEPRVPVPAEALADPAQRERWRREKGMLVFTFVDPDDPLRVVDVFIEHRIPFEKAWKRRVVRNVGKVPVPVLLPGDLMTLKKGTGRLQDYTDIENLKRYEKQIQKDIGKKPW